MQMSRTDIKSMDLPQLREYIISVGGKRYNRDRIYRWLHQKRTQVLRELNDGAFAGLLREIGADFTLQRRKEEPVVSVESG